ncbi:MAG TPA: glycosyltransferase family 39 protein [Bacteroidales bacterium]|nr:glycosyltransferase family 39 protein [Bacteroidales bacterium]
MISDLIILIVCLTGYAYAFRVQQKNRHLLALSMLVLLGMILRTYLSLDLFLHPWDERYHALVAKNMLQSPFSPMLYNDPIMPFDYRDWSANHIWLHKQPLPLWLMSVGVWLFGNTEFAIRVPSILFSGVGIAFMYLLARELYDKKVAFLSAFLFSIHGLILEITAGRVATDHVDLFFLVFVLAAVYFSVKSYKTGKLSYSIFCGFSIGLAILCKWLPALIVFGIWGILVFKKWPFWKMLGHLSVMLLITTVVALPWQIYIHLRYPAEALWENGFNVKHITEVLDGNGGPLYYHFDKLRMIYGELIYLPILWLTYKIIRRKRNRTDIAVFLWFLIPFVFFSIPKTKMQAYTLFAAPAIFLIQSLFIVYLFRYRKVLKPKILTYTILFLLMALPVRYSTERMKFFTAYERQPQWATDIKTLKKSLPENTHNLVIFNTPHPIETMFYIDCIAYDFVPDSTLINNIKDRGYTVKIMN